MLAPPQLLESAREGPRGGDVCISTYTCIQCTCRYMFIDVSLLSVVPRRVKLPCHVAMCNDDCVKISCGDVLF